MAISTISTFLFRSACEGLNQIIWDIGHMTSAFQESSLFRYMYSLIDTRAVKLEFLITWVAWHLLCQPRDSWCLLTLLHGDLVLYRRRHRLALFHRLVFTDLLDDVLALLRADLAWDLLLGDDHVRVAHSLRHFLANLLRRRWRHLLDLADRDRLVGGDVFHFRFAHLLGQLLALLDRDVLADLLLPPLALLADASVQDLANLLLEIFAHLFLNLLLLGLLSLFSDAILNGLGLTHDLGLFLHRGFLNFNSLALLNVPGFAHLVGLRL